MATKSPVTMLMMLEDDMQQVFLYEFYTFSDHTQINVLNQVILLHSTKIAFGIT